MKGTLTVIKTTGEIEKTEFDHVQSLDDLTKAVGGYIELIPYFEKYEGKPCIAYCNEEGKLDGLPLNVEAQVAWEKALGQPIFEDHLVGNIVVVQGDKEFMEAQ